MANTTQLGLRAGEQLGNLEYPVDGRVLDAYRRLAGADAVYPNLIADDCRALVAARCGALPVATIWQRHEFLRPPVPGRRIQVGGWLRELGERDDGIRLRVAAFAVDEIGTEILRSEAVFVVGTVDAAADGQGGPEPATSGEGVGDAAGTVAGDRVPLGTFALPGGEGVLNLERLGGEMSGVASGDGMMPALVSGWLEGVLGRWFGDDFRWGGRLAVGFRRPVRAGEVLTGEGVVIGHDADARGVATYQITAPILDARGKLAADAYAIVNVPSPRTL